MLSSAFVGKWKKSWGKSWHGRRSESEKSPSPAPHLISGQNVRISGENGFCPRSISLDVFSKWELGSARQKLSLTQYSLQWSERRRFFCFFVFSPRVSIIFSPPRRFFYFLPPPRPSIPLLTPLYRKHIWVDFLKNRNTLSALSLNTRVGTCAGYYMMLFSSRLTHTHREKSILSFSATRVKPGLSRRGSLLQILMEAVSWPKRKCQKPF